jgi:hypothetical protein
MIYKAIGKRYLKRYTAAALTPVYAAATDAAAVVRALCDVEWSAATATAARMAYHTADEIDDAGTTGFEANVAMRDELDAALFCAEHAGGMHRAYANAACYVFELPDMSSYPDIVAVRARVVSDPYNSGGVRLAVHLADECVIPRDCATARAGIAHVAGVVPRAEEVGSDKRTYWHAASERVTVAVNAPGKKYLMLVVALEDYSRSRGDWLEGSAYILPEVEIETAGAIDSWSESGVNAPGGSREWVIRLETGSFSPAGGERAASVACDWASTAVDFKAAVEGGGGTVVPFVSTGTRVSDLESVTTIAPAAKAAAINACYARIAAGKGREPYLVREYGDNATVEWCAGTDGKTAFVGRKALAVPFVMPDDFRARALRLSWAKETSLAVTGTPIKRNVWLMRGRAVREYRTDVLPLYELWTAATARVANWELVASLDCATGDTNAGVDFAVDIVGGAVHTILLTCFIDPAAFDFATPGAAMKLGAHWRSSPVWGAETPFASGGYVEGGWSPKVSLIG